MDSCEDLKLTINYSKLNSSGSFETIGEKPYELSYIRDETHFQRELHNFLNIPLDHLMITRNFLVREDKFIKIKDYSLLMKQFALESLLVHVRVIDTITIDEVSHEDFRKLRNVLTCVDCKQVITEPFMCSDCCSIYCEFCAEDVKRETNTCSMKDCESSPFECTREVKKSVKKAMEKVIVKCRYNCGENVSLLDYKDHLKRCKIVHEEVLCWNCNKAWSKPSELVISNKQVYVLKENELLEAKLRIENLAIANEGLVKENVSLLAKNKHFENELQLFKNLENKEYDAYVKNCDETISTLKRENEELAEKLRGESSEITKLRAMAQDYNQKYLTTLEKYEIIKPKYVSLKTKFENLQQEKKLSEEKLQREIKKNEYEQNVKQSLARTTSLNSDCNSVMSSTSFVSNASSVSPVKASNRRSSTTTVSTSKKFLLESEDCKLILSWLGKEANFEMVFKASESGFDSKSFYKHCLSTGPNIVVLLNSYQKKIGGFTPLNWKVNQGFFALYSEDITRNSFLFSLTNKKKYPLKNDNISFKNAICHHSGSGPSFGSVATEKGLDLEIVDNCNEKYTLSYGIGTIYQFSGDPKEFYGDASFLVEDYEVYRVIYK